MEGREEMTLFIFVFVSAFLWIYMGIEGYREGYYYHEANKTSEKKKWRLVLFIIGIALWLTAIYLTLN